MEKFNRIHWDPKYTVHVEAIDLQHQKLFEITNKLIDKYENGSSECLETIEELVNYLSEHFHAEQLIMMKSNYPGFQMHIKEHQSFIEKVEGFLRGYRNNEDNLTFNILTFLRDWIFSHTTSFDLKFGKHLLNSQYPK
ncbi:MAG: bacteriohemerythrin [Syntrophaceae bacterium]